VYGPVQCSVAAAVEPVPGPLAAAGCQRAGTGEGGVVAHSAGVGGYHDLTAAHWGLLRVAEALLDLDQSFGRWRIHHALTVERQIGGKPGTGGSSGVNYPLSYNYPSLPRALGGSVPAVTAAAPAVRASSRTSTGARITIT